MQHTESLIIKGFVGNPLKILSALKNNWTLQVLDLRDAHHICWDSPGYIDALKECNLRILKVRNIFGHVFLAFKEMLKYNVRLTVETPLDLFRLENKRNKVLCNILCLLASPNKIPIDLARELTNFLI